MRQKILHVVESAFAGVGRHILDLTAAQAAQGLDVHVAASSARMSSSFVHARDASVAVTWHEMSVGRSPSLADVAERRRLAALAAEIGPNIIHGHSTKGGLLARLMPRGEASVVYTPHAPFSMNPQLPPAAQLLAGSVERWLARRTDAVIAVSPEEREHLTGLGIDRGKVHVVPNGVVPQDRAEPEMVRMHLGLPIERPVIGFVGRLEDQKAPDDLVKIFAAVAKADPMVCFAVVGDGPRRSMLAAAASEPPLQGRMHLLGHQPGVWAMSAFDLLVLPSRYEGFPYVLLEAAHLGIPTVVSDRAGASLLAQGPSVQHVAPVGAAAEMAEACLGLLGQVRRRGRGSFPRDRRFTVSAMERQTYSVYERVLSPAGRAFGAIGMRRGSATTAAEQVAPVAS